MKKYNFNQPNELNGYSLFNSELEENENILFHITPETNFKSILTTGFQSASKLGLGRLESVSYAFSSARCLAHLGNRTDKKYVVFIVKFDNLKDKGIRVNQSDIHVFNEVQPKIIGYCFLPKGFSYN